MLYDEDQRVPGFAEIAILSNEKVDGMSREARGVRRDSHQDHVHAG